jgi:hypothetical protein
LSSDRQSLAGMGGGSLRGVLIDAPIIVLPAKFPDAMLDYTIEIPAAIDPTVDFIASVALAVKPSGAGEMQISSLTVADDSLTYTASGGQPGRYHTLKFIVTMTDGRVFPFIGLQVITPVSPWDQAPRPPSWGFGAVLTWVFAPSLVFTQPRNTGLRLWGWH